MGLGFVWDIFESKLTFVAEECVSGIGQLLIFNVLVKSFLNHNDDNDYDGDSCRVAYISTSSGFPAPAFEEYISGVRIASQVDFDSLKKKMLSGISVNQVFRPQSLLEEVVKIENLIKRKKYNAEKLLIVIQDLNILFGMVAYHSYSESHALASEIFMKLRKLAQIDHVSIIVSDTVQLKGKSFQIFSKRFYDYLLLLDHEGESVKISIDDVNDNLRYFNRDDNNRIDLKEEEQLVIIAQIQEFWEFLPSTISTDESAINIAKN